MNHKLYTVAMVEHSESFDDEIHLCKTFVNYDDAVKDVKERVKQSLSEFPDEVQEEWNLVRIYNTEGKVNYGCVWNILEIPTFQTSEIPT